ncbi:MULTISPECIES: ATP-binding protein [Paenibacillus]|uniref:DNA replication protein n=1 Tax=Paenibacillus odorifer TaxID=189426 RepID=A0ABX3HLR7_9BACL|nr:ATP-binding protein [Paenibacillus odorifer]OMD18628.1 DNA replication protein [Paenibacillus odorifer]OMD50450.1 DNA replication protein [Paenibacillus odorifer]
MEDPYVTCESCVVKDWCGRRNRSVPLPPNYLLNAECSGFVMLEQALKLSRIPKEYRNANLRNFKFDDDNGLFQKQITGFLQRPLNVVEKGFNLALFHQNKGTGKTYTACAIMNEFIYKGCMNPEIFDFENPLALYIKFNTWANKNRDRYRDDAMYEESLRDMEQMREAPLLVLDDIGSGRITPVIRDLLYDVIDYRKEEQKSTIYTSNFVDSVLRQDAYLGGIIVSRMMYNTVLIDLGGRDKRQS